MKRIAALCLVALSFSPHRLLLADTPVQDAKIHIGIDAGDARVNFDEFSRQADVQLLYDFTRLRGMKTPTLHGDYTVTQALAKLLEKLPLKYAWVNDTTLAITPNWIIDFNLPAGVAGDTLTMYETIAPVSVFSDPAVVNDQPTRAVVGRYDLRVALGMMLEGSGLKAVQIDASTYVVKPKFWAIRRRHQPAGSDPEVLVTADLDSSDRASIASVGSPIESFGLRDIRQSGATSVADFLKTIPQVWGGGPTDHTSATREAQMNPGSATGVNLRAADAGAARVTVDGISLAANGAAEFVDVSNIPLAAIQRIDITADGASAQYGDAVSGSVNFVTRGGFSGNESSTASGVLQGQLSGQHDLSQIVSTLWDGGTATLALEYNVRESLPAASRLQATSNLTRWGGPDLRSMYGDPGNVIGAQGQTWAIVQTPGGTTFEPAQKNLYDGWRLASILPQQKLWSMVGKARLNASDSVDVWGEFLASSRHTQQVFQGDGSPGVVVVSPKNPFYQGPPGATGPTVVVYGFGSLLGPMTGDAQTTALTTAVGFETHADENLKFKGQLSYSGQSLATADENVADAAKVAASASSQDPSLAFDPFRTTENDIRLAQSFRTAYRYYSTTALMEARGDLLWTIEDSPGFKLFGLGGGNVTRNTLHSYAPPLAVNQREDLGRSSSGTFVSLRSEFSDRYEISSAARYENDGLGGVVLPRFGARVRISPHLAVRSTWGRAYRDANLYDLDESQTHSQVLALPDASGPSTVLALAGSNSTLGAERSETWTLGLDGAGDRWEWSASYFNVVSAGRAYQPTLAMGSLLDPTFNGVIIRNPTLAQRGSACASAPSFATVSQCLVAPFDVIVDVRVQNLDTLRTSGADILGRYFTVFDDGSKVAASFNASYLVDYSIRRGAGDQLIDLINTPDQPIRLRARDCRGVGAVGRPARSSTTHRPIETRPWIPFDASHRGRATTLL